MKKIFTQRMVLAAIMMVAGYAYALADDGDVFSVKTKEGVMMTFTVSSESDKTCFVGDDSYLSNSDACIDQSVTGTVTVPETAMGYRVTRISEYAFQYCNIEECVIPKSVSIDFTAGLFYSCKKLKKFWFNDGIDRIPVWFFNGCESLEDVYIPSSVKMIRERAFKGCKSLMWLQIPENVTSIGERAFENMTDCDFSFLPATPPTFGENCFDGMSVFDYAEYGGEGLELSSMIHVRSEEAVAAYTAELKKQEYLKDLYLNVVSGFYRLLDREATGYMIAGYPDFEKGTLNYVGFSEIPGADVTELVIPEKVKGLDLVSISDIFGTKGSTTITKIVLPSTLKQISTDCFRDFSALKDINLPEGLETIYSWSFAGCSSLEEIIFPSTLKSLERGAFRYCDKLSSVYMNARNVDLFSGEYAGNSACEHATMYVPFGTFKYYDTEQWHNEFRWRAQMDPRDGDIFPSEYKTGKDMWFQVINAQDKTCRVYGDEAMRAVETSTEGAANIPQKPEGFTVTEIGEYAFLTCGKLTVVNIPNTVKLIGNGAFGFCTGLVSASIPSSVETIGESAFAFATKLASVTLQEGLKEIGAGAFGFTGVYSVTLPSTLKELGLQAFYGCSNLTDINIPDGINEIKSSTFALCRNLTSIELPASVATLGYHSFYNCDNLGVVKIHNARVRLVDEDGHATSDNGAFAEETYHWSELCMPEGSFDYYNQEPWTTWFGAMVSSLPYVATGIGQVEKSVEAPALWYSLDGKPMLSAPTKPGLYIRNGKKVVVK